MGLSAMLSDRLTQDARMPGLRTTAVPEPLRAAAPAQDPTLTVPGQTTRIFVTLIPPAR